MASRNIEKMASIDAQLRLLAPSKVSDDDKLVEYDALLLDRFLDILQDLHGDDIRETVIAMPLHPPPTFSHYTPSYFFFFLPVIFCFCFLDHEKMLVLLQHWPVSDAPLQFYKMVKFKGFHFDSMLSDFWNPIIVFGLGTLSFGEKNKIVWGMHGCMLAGMGILCYVWWVW